MKLTKDFRALGDKREFMYLTSAKSRAELKPFLELVKAQGDLYRITKYDGRFILWDARV